MTTADEKMTLCWNCSRPYPMSDEQCTHCAATNANHSFEVANAEIRIKELEQQNEQLQKKLKDALLNSVSLEQHNKAVDALSTSKETIEQLQSEVEGYKSAQQKDASALANREAEIEQLQSQASSACEFYQSIIDANYRTWDCGLDNAEEFVRWIKSRAAHALSLSDTQTAEAYKRRIQADALEKAATYFEQFSGMQYVNPEERLRRMAAELKEGEQG